MTLHSGLLPASPVLLLFCKNGHDTQERWGCMMQQDSGSTSLALLGCKQLHCLSSDAVVSSPINLECTAVAGCYAHNVLTCLQPQP